MKRPILIAAAAVSLVAIATISTSHADKSKVYPSLTDVVSGASHFAVDYRLTNDATGRWINGVLTKMTPQSQSGKLVGYTVEIMPIGGVVLAAGGVDAQVPVLITEFDLNGDLLKATRVSRSINGLKQPYTDVQMTAALERHDVYLLVRTVLQSADERVLVNNEKASDIAIAQQTGPIGGVPTPTPRPSS